MPRTIPAVLLCKGVLIRSTLSPSMKCIDTLYILHEQSGAHYEQSSEYQPPGGLDSSDLQQQLSAAKRFLLGPEDSVDSPSYNFIQRDEGINGIDTFSSHDISLQSGLNPDWNRTTHVTLQSN